MKTVNEIRNLSECGKDIKNFINNKLPELRRRFRDEGDTLDKHGSGWSINGDKIQSVNIKLSYSSFSGHYGNSSSYSDITFDTTLFVKYFIKYLNDHNDEIFNEIGDNMIKDVGNLRDSALKEIDELRQQIDQI